MTRLLLALLAMLTSLATFGAPAAASVHAQSGTAVAVQQESVAVSAAAVRPAASSVVARLSGAPPAETEWARSPTVLISAVRLRADRAHE